MKSLFFFFLGEFQARSATGSGMDLGTDRAFDTVECGDETGLDMVSDGRSSKKSLRSLSSIVEFSSRR